jgi:hypothetical protein
MTTVMKTNFTLTALETTLAFSALFGIPYSVDTFYKELHKHKDLDPKRYAEANIHGLYKTSGNSDIARNLTHLLDSLATRYYEVFETPIGDDETGIYEGLATYLKNKLGLKEIDSIPNFIQDDFHNIGWTDFVTSMNTIYKNHSLVEHDMIELISCIKTSIKENIKYQDANMGLYDSMIEDWYKDLLLGDTLLGQLAGLEDYATEVEHTYFVRYSGGLDLDSIDLFNPFEHDQIVMELNLDDDITHRFTFNDLRYAKPIKPNAWQVMNEDGDFLTLSFYEVTPVQFH